MADTIQITKDSYVSSTSPDTNYGTSISLPCYYESSLKTYVFIEPDISSITNMEDVVDIYMVISTVSAYGGTLRTQRPSSSWAESTITYNNMPSVHTSYDERTIPASYDGFQYWDLTAYYGLEQIGEVTDYGFRFDRSDLAESYPIEFRSSDFSSTSVRPYLRVRYLDDDFDGYATDSGSFMTNINNYIPFFGNAIVYDDDSSQTYPYTAQCNVSPPWTSSYMGTEYLDEGESVTYSTSITGGTEYFIVENTSTGYNAEIGYYPIFTAVWYRDYGARYVKTDGDDDDSGLTWNSAFESIEKGMSETPDGANLYIEEGMYSETLANLTLASGSTSINIIPMDDTHVSTNSANVVIGTGTVTTDGTTSGGSSGRGGGTEYYQFWCDTNVASSTCIIQTYGIGVYSTASATVRFKLTAYRVSGTTMTFVDSGVWSDWYTVPSSGWYTVYDNLLAGISVQSGDVLMIQVQRADTNNVHVVFYGETGSTVYYVYTNNEFVANATTTMFTQQADSELTLKVMYFT
jgi:hypothetical protein